MYIIDCIPIKKIPRGHPQVLSYFYASALPAGAVVLGEIRTSKVPMLVVASARVSERKAAIRKQEFQLKPLHKPLFDYPVISESYISFLKLLADYFFVPVSYFAALALPPARVLESPTFQKTEINFVAQPKRTTPPKKTLIWGTRLDYLLDKIRRVIHDQENVLILVPDEIQLNHWTSLMKIRDIPFFRYQRSSSVNAWKKVYEELPGAKGCVIIGVFSTVFAPVSHIGLVAVIFDESSAYYHNVSRPFFHAGFAAQLLTKKVGADFVAVSHSPSLKRYQGVCDKNMELVEDENITSIDACIIDARMQGKNRKDIIVPDTVKKLEAALEHKKNAVVFINRKGYSASVICWDCGTHVACANCTTPYTFHTEPKRALWCHHCGKSIVPPEACPICHSYNLDYFGIGVQRVTEELKKKLPSAEVIRFDADAFKNKKEERTVLQKFIENANGILVGSELMLKYVYELRVSLAVAVHFDRIFGLPDYSIEEQARRQLVLLRTMADRLIIQTYTPEREYFSKLHDIKAMYAEDLEQREKLGYPPFTQLIRVVFRNKKYAQAMGDAKIFETVLKRTKVTHSPPLPCFIAKEKGLHCVEIILRVPKPKTTGDIKRRNEVLKFAPAGCEIYIDPVGVL